MRLCYGAFIENGRIIDDSPNGKLKKMVRYLMDNYNVEMFITPNQDLLFGNISGREKKYFENDMIKMFGYGSRTICTNNSVQSNLNKRGYSNLRVLSGSCVGKDTCRLAYTDSEKFEPYLIDELESRWGHMSESIGITGCERQCFRPATKTIGWIGTGLNMYMLKLGGTEDGKNQGWPLVDPDSNEIFLRNVPRKDVATVTDALFEYYYSSNISSSYECRPGEMGYFFRRIGSKMIIQWLKSNPKTAHLMKPIQYSSSRSQSKAINPDSHLIVCLCLFLLLPLLIQHLYHPLVPYWTLLVSLYYFEQT
jgi:sulfite reductase (NADPH) hemoprotein beta-component